MELLSSGQFSRSFPPSRLSGGIGQAGMISEAIALLSLTFAPYPRIRASAVRCSRRFDFFPDPS
jgi:hypothetical protein